MKYLMIGVIIILASGCAMIESDAGKAHYIYEVTTADGTKHRVDLKNAKDVGTVMATVKYGDIEVELLEEGVNASSAMGVMATQNQMMFKSLMDLIPVPAAQ